MTIEIRRFESAAELRNAAEPFLLRNEAQHNLMLGLIGRLERTPDFYESQPYFAVALVDEEVVASALMTPPFPLVLSLCEDEEALDQLAIDLHALHAKTTGVNSPTPGSRLFADAWQRLTGEEAQLALAERVYKLERVRHPTAPGGTFRRATVGDSALVTSWRMAFVREAVPWEETSAEVAAETTRRLLGLPPDISGTFLWEDGEPVCLVGYNGSTPNGLRIGPVYTPPEFRRRGYASACTAAACQYILDSGRRLVTLFADLANPTSNHIYQEIGFEPVCDAEMVRFGGR